MIKKNKHLFNSSMKRADQHKERVVPADSMEPVPSEPPGSSQDDTGK